jgi:peptide/nickel transport system substrate-binding protein
MQHVGMLRRDHRLHLSQQALSLGVQPIWCAGWVVAAFAVLWQAPGQDRLVISGISGRAGGRLVYAQRTEPKTLNPLIATDAPSREVIPRLMADLIHINRFTQQVEPALARSWQVSDGGRRFTMELRRGVRFSDGSPFDADDVLFTFQAYLDDKLHSPQRDQLMPNGKPIVVRKLDSDRVAFELPEANAVGERLFDGFYILPRRLLEKAFQQGRLGEAWGLRTPPSQIAGLGPFRLKEYMPGQRLVFERNPYYWKLDRDGTQLPYLNELVFAFAGTEDTQALRFRSGEADVISRLSAGNFTVLQADAAKRGYSLQNLGGGMDFQFLVFNLNDPSRVPAAVAARVKVLSRRSLRAAISAAIDREAMVRLVYRGLGEPLATLVPPGSRLWVNQRIPQPRRDLGAARALLAADGFRWAGGRLLDPGGVPVEFTIAVSASNPERKQLATLIQADLRPLGITVQVAPLEFISLVDRVQRTFNYEAAVLGLGSADADPNADANVWLSSGSNHLWNPRQRLPATPWEAEIDDLMRRQAVTRQFPERKKLFDRVQEILAEQLPMVPLVSPAVLVGARNGLRNFRPAILDHSTLWNVEELYWAAGARP